MAGEGARSEGEVPTATAFVQPRVPVVSVVIPTYRRELALAEAVRSALAQDGVDLEVIVVDDSADNSAASTISALRDRRIQYVPCDVPTGGIPGRVRNRGLARARGEFVHFLDDDDELEPGALAALSGALLAAPGAGVAIGTVVPVARDPATLEHERRYFALAARRLRATSSRRAFAARLLFAAAPLLCSCCTIRRELARSIGGFAEDIPRAQDGDFYLRAVREAGFIFVDRPVVKYQTGALSLIHSPSASALLVESYRLIRRRYRQQRGTAEYFALRLLAVWQRVQERRATRGVDHRRTRDGSVDS